MQREASKAEAALKEVNVATKIPEWVQKITIPELGDNQPNWKEMIPERVWDMPEKMLLPYIDGVITALTNPDDVRNAIQPFSMDKLQDNPDYAVGCFMSAILARHRELLEQGEYELNADLSKLVFGWVYPQLSITKKNAAKLSQQDSGLAEIAMINLRAGKHGRPSTKRLAAIKALVLREYLHMPWREITKRVCPCGLVHNEAQIQAECKPVLVSETYILRRLMKKCQVTLLDLNTDTRNG
jgi:hypothetical protein